MFDFSEIASILNKNGISANPCLRTLEDGNLIVTIDIDLAKIQNCLWALRSALIPKGIHYVAPRIGHGRTDFTLIDLRSMKE